MPSVPDFPREKPRGTGPLARHQRTVTKCTRWTVRRCRDSCGGKFGNPLLEGGRSKRTAFGTAHGMDKVRSGGNSPWSIRRRLSAVRSRRRGVTTGAAPPIAGKYSFSTVREDGKPGPSALKSQPSALSPESRAQSCRRSGRIVPDIPGLILPSAADREGFQHSCHRTARSAEHPPCGLRPPTSRRYGPAVCAPARAQRMIKPQWGTHKCPKKHSSK